MLAVRPYETEAGRTDAVYQTWLQRLAKYLETRPPTDALAAELGRAAADLAAVPQDRSQPRPKIGIVGEIYVRHHTQANNNLIVELERFGAECVLSGFSEWMYYTNYLRKKEARGDWEVRTWLDGVLKDHVMRRTHKQLSVPFEPILGKFSEPTTEEVLALAEPYIHPTFQGEAILSIGKMIELAHHGCHGVVNVGPFSCMPSTIVAGVLKRVAETLHSMPTMTISYDGQQDPMQETRLEAFLYQARSYQRSREAVAAV
jgi:predicted nucleotide-binding protein (sugar kinase/HSP70/actin superfamily)